MDNLDFLKQTLLDMQAELDENAEEQLDEHRQILRLSIEEMTREIQEADHV